MTGPDPITILTGAIAALALVQAGIYAVQADIYAGMRKDTRSIERAYVDLSHAPPGLQIDPPQRDTQTIHCQIVLKNHGRTPASSSIRVTTLGASAAATVAPALLELKVEMEALQIRMGALRARLSTAEEPASPAREHGRPLPRESGEPCLGAAA
jgi:hypothetical protein